MRGRYRILLGMAAGVGKTYRMLQEGRAAHADGQDVVIGYLERHDRPQTNALAQGLEQVPRLRSSHGGLELEEMDVDAVVRRAPELALIDELAHTNAPEARNEKRWQDIDEVLAAGIDVISTVNIQHLESLNDAIAELTEVRVRETFPDQVLESADEVVLVDLTPEALQERLRAARSTRPTARASHSTTSSGPTAFRRCGSWRSARSRKAWEQPTGRRARPAQRAGGGGACARSGHTRAALPATSAGLALGRTAGRPSMVWVRTRGQNFSPDEQVQLAALRRLAVVLGARFLEEEGDGLVGTGERVVEERGSTYVLVGTPNESRVREVLRGWLVSALVRELPGIDIRVVENRADREERT